MVWIAAHHQQHGSRTSHEVATVGGAASIRGRVGFSRMPSVTATYTMPRPTIVRIEPAPSITKPTIAVANGTNAAASSPLAAAATRTIESSMVLAKRIN